MEISLEVTTKDDAKWGKILNCFYRNDFYLGAGETNSYGLLKVVDDIKYKCFDLSDVDENNTCLGFDVSLNGDIKFLDDKFEKNVNKQEDIQVNLYEEESITFSGENSFFHFGAGIGDMNVDDANYIEDVVVWSDDNTPDFKPYYVIPETSIKGTLAHRVAYHFNKKENEGNKSNTVENILDKGLKDINLEDFEKQLPTTLENLKIERNKLEKQLSQIKDINIEDLFEPYIGSNNEAVKEIFGIAKNSDIEEGQIGWFIVEDTYLPTEKYKEILFNHNKIDRFTGGTIDTALFKEKVLHLPEVTFKFKYKNNIWENKFLKEAINDLEKGMLPIGGKVNKGHGILIKK